MPSPPPHRPAEFAAVLLAGGRSSRMGRDKALLPHPDSGRPLILHQLATLRASGASQIFLSTREDQDYPLVPPEIPRIRDSGADGPLRAIATTLAATSAPHLLVLAVDLPHIGIDQLRALIASSTVNCGVAPFHPAGDTFEPLCAVYANHPESRAAFTAALADQRLSLQSLIRKAIKNKRMRTMILSDGETRFFANWNKPSDIMTLASARKAPG